MAGTSPVTMIRRRAWSPGRFVGTTHRPCGFLPCDEADGPACQRARSRPIAVVRSPLAPLLWFARRHQSSSLPRQTQPPGCTAVLLILRSIRKWPCRKRNRRLEACGLVYPEIRRYGAGVQGLSFVREGSFSFAGAQRVSAPSNDNKAKYGAGLPSIRMTVLVCTCA